MAKKAFLFPDITESLYVSKTMKEFQNLYMDQLRETEQIHNILYANKILEYQNITNNQDIIWELEHDFCELKNHLFKWMKKQNHKYHITLKKRQKDFIGYNDKIRLYLNDQKPLSKISDILGFRIRIDNGPVDTIESIKFCYNILTEVFHFFIFEKKCYPIEAEPKNNTGFSKDIHPDIIVPDEDFIDSELVGNVKDYIKNPKANGYQSLHVVFVNPQGIKFEIQIRTQPMDILADDQNHDQYKDNRYPQRITFDRSKVKLQGYVYTKNKVFDSIGLESSFDPFNTFGE